jgi:hypothetical protein
MAIPRSKQSDRLCTFTFADGRRCQTPCASGELEFCYFHGLREAKRLMDKKVCDEVAAGLPTDYVSACGLTATMGRLFDAILGGHIKPKTASTLVYLSQVMLQAIPLAENEFLDSFGHRKLVSKCIDAFGQLNPKYVRNVRAEWREAAEAKAAKLNPSNEEKGS